MTAVSSTTSKVENLTQDFEVCPPRLRWPRGINKDLTVWLNGARPLPKYIFKNNMSSTKFD